MQQSVHRLSVETNGKGFYDIGDAVVAAVKACQASVGLVTLFCQHTSASLLIQENADADVRADLSRFFDRLAPEADNYQHAAEGEDDMPAHMRATLLPTHVCVPIEHGRLTLGPWQGIYLVEHRRDRRERTILMHILVD
jgi:secondary thiamine-phosphate synthase enzyme